MTEFEMITTLTECPLCGSNSFIRLPLPGHWIGQEVFAPIKSELGLSKCQSCGLIFTNPRPDPEMLGRFYSGNTYSCHKPDQSLGASRKATFLLSLLDGPGQSSNAGKRLLDFGCGGGFLLRSARDTGWNASGFDPGKESVKACQAQGLTVFDSLDNLPSGSFDVVTMIHVLEHVVDYAGLFAVFKRVLAPHGRLLIEVPNVRSLRARLSAPLLTRHANFDERYRAFPIHLSYFTTDTLSRLLQKHGFQVAMSSTSGMSVEEILMRPEETHENNDDAASGSSAAPPSWSPKPGGMANATIKRCFYSLGLGENLVTIATPAAPVR